MFSEHTCLAVAEANLWLGVFLFAVHVHKKVKTVETQQEEKLTKFVRC